MCSHNKIKKDVHTSLYTCIHTYLANMKEMQQKTQEKNCYAKILNKIVLSN